MMPLKDTLELFSPPIIAGEFAARVATHHAPAALTHGPLTLHPAQHVAMLAGQRLTLSATEFAALARLMRRPGDVVTLAELHAATHTADCDRIEAGNQVRPVVAAMRRKLPAGLIENVRGVGYRLAYD